MAPGDLLVVLGLNGRVIALLRKDGRVVWATDLPGILGDHFVTIACDDACVYAYTHGQLHCLDMQSGRILWSNELKGFGYGTATICVPGSAADAVPAAHVRDEAGRQRTRITGSRSSPPAA